MKITIITACFNSSATIRDTFESVLRQSHADVEHIVVDGGSRDDTVEIIREYAEKYQGRMRWISEKDDGIYYAMNKGIAQRADALSPIPVATPRDPETKGLRGNKPRKYKPL